MAAQDGFASGMQMGLVCSMPCKMPHISSNSWRMRKRTSRCGGSKSLLMRNRRLRHSFSNGSLVNEFIINNASKMGTDMVLDAYNEMNSMMGA